MNWKLKRKIIELYGTRTDFSKKAHIDEAIISKVVRSRKKLSKEEQKRWSKLLSCQPKDIFHIGTDN